MGKQKLAPSDRKKHKSLACNHVPRKLFPTQAVALDTIPYCRHASPDIRQVPRASMSQKHTGLDMPSLIQEGAHTSGSWQACLVHGAQPWLGILYSCLKLRPTRERKGVLQELRPAVRGFGTSGFV